MSAAPPRYLVAYLEARVRDRLALLRFPPGVTLEDAGCDWVSLDLGAGESPLPAGAVGRLRRLGVEVVAMGERPAFEALRRAGAESARADVGAFAEDYLDANARLGGRRCVGVAEYAMHTRVGEQPLRDALRDCLSSRRDVRAYGDLAFRAGRLPRLLRLRLGDLALVALNRHTHAWVPCRLHGSRCRSCSGPGYNPGMAILHAVDPRHTAARVVVPRRLVDDMGLPGHRLRVARAARELARAVIEALPDGAWSLDQPSWALESVVAAAVAGTCEEYKMLVQALMECGSAREVVRRARDSSWAVSRTLERLQD